MRLLDLLRRLRRRGQPVHAAQARAGAGPRRGGVGLGVADEPARALQPRLGRPRRHAVERAQEARLVGRGREDVDRRRRPGLPGDHRTGLPPARGRHGPPRPSAGTSRSSCRPTAGPGCTRPAGLLDGPMPTHYEPQESPVPNALYPRQRANPARQEFHREGNRYHPEPGAPGADVFPYVFTTFRVTEHHTAGGMSRWTPHLNELMPEMFLRGLARARRGARAGERPVVPRRHRAIRDRGQGAGHRAGQAAEARRHRDPPDRGAVALGLERPGHRRRRERAAVASRSTPTSTSWRRRRPPATSGPAGVRAGRSWSTLPRGLPPTRRAGDD